MSEYSHDDYNQMKAIVNSTLDTWDRKLDLPYHLQISAATSILLTLIMQSGRENRQTNYDNLMTMFAQAFESLKEFDETKTQEQSWPLQNLPIKLN